MYKLPLRLMNKPKYNMIIINKCICAKIIRLQENDIERREKNMSHVLCYTLIFLLLLKEKGVH